MNTPHSQAEKDAWVGATSWDDAERFRRQAALAMTPTQRIDFLEQLLEMAIVAGNFRNKFGERFPKERL